MSDNIKHRSSAGFTIVELTVSITLLGIILVSVLAVVTNYLVLITRNETLVNMTVDSQNLLRASVEELRYGAGVRQTNSITDTNQPSGWNTSNAAFVIIIAVPALDTDREYIIDSSTGKPYSNELVYFKQGTVLYKRTLAHPSASGNSRTTSCPAASATPSCPSDRVLNENTKDMVFTLYDQDDAITNDALLARSVRINLLLEQDTFGQPISFENSIRVTLRNQF